MKYTLPLASPPITSHPDLALPLSIMMTVPHIRNWLCSEFIQLYTTGGIYIKRYNYGSCEEYEPLESIRIPFHLQLQEDLIAMYIQYLKHGYYILVFCDDSKISCMKVKYSRLHGVLLHGFDEEEKLFYAYAYINGKLQFFSFPFQELLDAYYSDFAAGFGGRGAKIDFLGDHFATHTIQTENHLTVLYRIKPYDYSKYDVNLGKIKWHLCDYLHSVDTLARERFHLAGGEAYSWGMGVYPEMRTFYHYLKAQQYQINPADPYCIYEHKKNMAARFQYIDAHSSLKCSSDILNWLSELEVTATVFIDLLLKYNFKIHSKNADSAFEGMLNYLDSMEEQEKRILHTYYENNRPVFESF